MPLIDNTDTRFHFECDECNQYLIVLDSPLSFTAGDCHYVIEPGYVSDGMSVPEWLWMFISPKFNPVTLLPSLVHDWLYDNHVMTREEADNWYRSALIENGFPCWKTGIVYAAVRKFGESHWGNG